MNPQDADVRSGERRRNDTDGDRRNDRRHATGRRRGDLTSTGFAADSRHHANHRADHPADAGADSFFDPGWLAAGDAGPRDHTLLRQVQRIVQAQDSALSRVLRTYAAARAAVGLGLVLAQATSSIFSGKGNDVTALVCVLYAAQAISLWLLPGLGGLGAVPLNEPTQAAAAVALARRRRRQWLATIGVDLLAFSLLHMLEAGAAFNYGALLVLPVLMAGVLTSRVLALGTAAGVALMLLAVSWRGAAGSAEASALMLQSGLGGLGLFVIALMAGELAGRLAREELAARDSLALARQQAQLNRLVIEEMADGVLVIDRQLRVRAANPAARALLVDQGLGPPAPFTLQLRPAWEALHHATERALAKGHWSEAGEDVMLSFGQGHTRTLRLRVRFMRGRGERTQATSTDRADLEQATVEPFAVLLLEDLRTLQARLRQDKLAAMGRVSAGIAHEIRNPLAAIAQANDLLLEDELPPAQQRLAQMVADNVQRLKRLVDDVMDLAPGTEVMAAVIDATATVEAITTDWARTSDVVLAPEGRLRVEWPSQRLDVMFDPEHLRRVVVNLLDNAHRHASPVSQAQSGAIFMRLAARDSSAVVLSVLSDGPAIAPEVERFLFEPFFSTRSRGSGLGLYICRELCARYGASIEYRPRPAAERLRNEFFVTLRRAPGIA
jgi:two-component system, NtrC family, sensor histidine kinase PilS